MNKLWAMLAGDGKDPSDPYTRNTAGESIKIPEADKSAVNALTEGSDGDLRSFHAECLTQMTFNSPLRELAVSMDPVNTYDNKIWTDDNVSVVNDTSLWYLFKTTPGYKNPIETYVLSVNGPADTVTITGPDGARTENMNSSGGLTRVLKLSDTLSVTLRGDMASTEGLLTFTDSRFPLYDIGVVKTGLPVRGWNDPFLNGVWVNGTPVEALAAYILDIFKGALILNG